MTTIDTGVAQTLDALQATTAPVLPGPPRVGTSRGARPREASPAPVEQVAVVGLGYVGLPTALAFAAAGVPVVGVDVDQQRLAAIRTGDVDLLPEDHLRLGAHRGTPHLTFTDDTADALTTCSAVVICVPTPVDEHQTPDLRALTAACAGVVRRARPGQTIVLTSTSYVGTTRDLLVDPLEERGFTVGEDVFVAFSPERIDPGNVAALQSTTPRVVGGRTVRCTERAAGLVARCSGGVHVVSSPEAAELTKLVENTFRAVNIALANEFADVSDQLDLDVMEVIGAASSKPFGFMPFFPGPGVGGHCIPCDPYYLIWQLRALHVDPPLIESAMRAISARPHAVVTRSRQLLADAGLPMTGSRVLIVGVAYKPGVCDVRESPAVQVMQELRAGGATVAYHDDRVVSLGGVPRVDVPDPGDWDLVVVHTLHPDADLRWLLRSRLVLDASFRLSQTLPGLLHTHHL